jgi:tetratricopeptide (TPR) repeat protein
MLLAAVLTGGQRVARAEGTAPDPAAAAWGEAQLAIGEKECPRAVVHLRQVLVHQPDRWEAHQLAAECLLKLGRNAEALQHYREWARLRPQDEAAAAGIQEATARQRALDERREARERERDSVKKIVTKPSLAALAREQGHKTPASARTFVLNGTGGMVETSSAANAADGAASLLDSMRQRAESILRPSMSAIAADARQLTVVRQRYTDACQGKVTSTVADGVRHGRGVGVSGTIDPARGGDTRTWSEWSWVEEWRSQQTQRNEETVECRTIASDIDRLSGKVAAVLDGSAREMDRHPAVYRGIREEVFTRLAGELW